MIRNRLIALALATAAIAGGSGCLAVGVASAYKSVSPVAVEIAPPKTKPGNKCRDGTAGCTHGKFTGNFFGD